MKFNEHQIIASLCRKSYVDFVKQFWHTTVQDKLVWNFHMDVVCEALQDVAERVFRGEPKKGDLVINISPGTSKSSLASVLFLPWLWTRMPHCQYIGASYGYDLSLTLSRKSRDVVRSELYRKCFPEIRLRQDQDTKGLFANTRGGFRLATSSGSNVMGFHGHIIGIDDPLDPQSVVSDAEMEVVNRWLREKLSGRKVDHRITPMILIMQRLSREDPTWMFLQRKGTVHYCLPAELLENVHPPELRSKYRDGLMDPIRLPKEVLEEKRKELGPFAYAAQYEESPIPLAGGMFETDKINTVRIPPKRFKRVVRFWDKAGTAGKIKRGRGSWTVGAKLGLDEANRIFILSIIRVRMGSFDREKLIKATAREDGRSVTIGIEAEPGSGGKESAENTLRNLIGYIVRLDHPHGDKETRADPLSVQVNGGNVYMVEGDWNKEFIQEMKHFPYSTFKDQVDATAGAFAMLWRNRIRVGGMQSRAEIAKGELA